MMVKKKEKKMVVYNFPFYSVINFGLVGQGTLGVMHISFIFELFMDGY